MLYRKNLPNWERSLRVIAGITLVTYGLIGAPSVLIAALALVSAVVVLVTGFVGYCPACAIAGRKFVQPSTRED
jgi:hypothetical protein